jgi:hypothetical protein
MTSVGLPSVVPPSIPFAVDLQEQGNLQRNTARRASLLDVVQRTYRQVKLEAPLSITALSHGIIGGTAWASSQRLTPFLMSLGGSTAIVEQTLQSVPTVGSMLGPLLSRGGVLGVVLSATTLFTCVQAMMGQEPGAAQGVAWAVAQACLGLCLSPLWMMAAAGTVPSSVVAVGLAVGCTLMVNTMLNESLCGAVTTQPMALTAAVGITAGAPISAELAQGVAPGMVTGQVLLTLALGALIGAGYVTHQYYSHLSRPATSFLQKAVVHHRAEHRLNLLQEPNPTVFLDEETNTELVQELKSMRANLKQHLSLGLRKVLMHGPPGTGKTVTAQAIAHFINGEMFAPNVGEVLISPRPAESILRYFNEAIVRSRRTHRPVVLFFDESEKLLAQRHDTDTATSEQHQRSAAVAVFNTILDGVQKVTDQSVVVIVATNHLASLDQSIKERFRILTINHPPAATVDKMLTQKWAVAQKESGLGLYRPYEPQGSVLAAMHTKVQAEGWSGREIYNHMLYAARQVSGERMERADSRQSTDPAWFTGAMDQAVQYYFANPAKIQST